MAKEKMDTTRQNALEQENIILKQKLADAERTQASNQGMGSIGDRLSNEMKKIRQKGKAQGNSITVVTDADYKQVSLWTKYGKRIGPMHPDNAIQTLNRFADIGVYLTADKPTPEQIEEYKQTTEYKAMIHKEADRRATKDKSKKSGQMEKLAAEIAKMSGTTVEALNQVLKMHEVKTK